MNIESSPTASTVKGGQKTVPPTVVIPLQSNNVLSAQRQNVAFPLLPQPMATSISNIISATRLSIRSADVLSSYFFNVSKMATRLTLRKTKDLLLSFYSSDFSTTSITDNDDRTKRLHQTSSSELSVTPSASNINPPNTTDKYAIQLLRALIYSQLMSVSSKNDFDGLVRKAFQVLETFTLGTIDLSCTLTCKSIRAVDEVARIIDGVFGSTDTSFALRAFVELLDTELLQPSRTDGTTSFASMGTLNIVKSFGALTCMQQKARERHLENIKMVHIFSLILESDSEYSEHMAKGEVNDQVQVMMDASAVTNDQNALIITDDSVKVDSESVNEQKAEPNKLYNAVDGLLTINWTLKLDDRTLSDLKPFHSSPEQLLCRLRTYSKYATAAYGRQFMYVMGIAKYDNLSHEHMSLDADGRLHHPHHRIFSQHTGVQLHCIIASTHHSPSKIIHRAQNDMLIRTPTMHSPDYFISVDHRNKSVCVTIRGTLGLSDLLTNATCSYSPIKLNGSVHHIHAGMLQQALWLNNDKRFFDTVRHALMNWSQYSLVLIGHSMGAGVATALGILWSDFDKLPSEKDIEYTAYVLSARTGLPAGRLLHVYSFSPASIVSLKLSKQCQGFVTSTIHGKDCIASLSLGSARDLRDSLRYLNTHKDPQTMELLSTRLIKNAIYGNSNRSIVPCQKLESDIYDPAWTQERYRSAQLRAMPFGFKRSSEKSDDSQLALIAEQFACDALRQHSPRPSFTSALAGNENTQLAMDSLESLSGVSVTPGEAKKVSETSVTMDEWFDSITQECKSVKQNAKLYACGDIYWLHSDEISVPGSYVGKESPSRSRRGSTSSSRSFRPLASSSSSMVSEEPPKTTEGWVQTRRVIMSRIVAVEEMFGEIIFSRSMMMDHSPGRMEYCLDALGRANR